MEKDYYELLGVPKDASTKAIKDAYHRLAMKYHPDRNPAADAEEKFKAISKAYAILSDPKKRANYDASGFEGVKQYSQDDLFRDLDLGGIFGDMGLGGGSIFDRFFHERTRGAARGQDLFVNIQVPLEVVANGGTEKIRYSRPILCSKCGGYGTKSGKAPRPCSACQGTGKKVLTREQSGKEQGHFRFQQIVHCPECHGRGTLLEEACEDCHGSPIKKPEYGVVLKENNSALIEAQNYAVKNKYEKKLVKTKKGRFYSNVYYENGDYYLISKRKGKIYKLSIITGDKTHRIYGHDSLDCTACHSKVVQQCYGCHTIYNESMKQFDVIEGKTTEGGFYEKEDIRKLYPFPLAVNEKGKIGPITPGCQTFLTYINKKGEKIFEDKIPEFKGKKQFKYVSFYSHNTGEKAVDCVECHSQLYFAGFGDALVSIKNRTVISPIWCESCEKPLGAINYIINGKIHSTGSMVRERSRNLNKKELISFIKINNCLLCHRKGDEKLYEKNIDYNRIDKCLSLFRDKQRILR